MTRFENKTVWITGASSGIGKALAEAFAGEGANVILSGRRLEALQAVADTLPTDSMVLPFEATDYTVLPETVDAAWTWKSRVDILVNNAGVTQRSFAEDTAPEVYRDLLDIDLLAPIWLTQLQLPKMIEAGGGHIVAISSVAGRLGAPLRTAYSAAKHGLIGYMDALRAEVSLRHNINVTNILPGSVKTNISRNAMTADGGRRGKSDAQIEAGDDPADCARATLNAVAANTPELVFASGMELELAKMRHANPEQLFTLASQFAVQLAEQYENETND